MDVFWPRSRRPAAGVFEISQIPDYDRASAVANVLKLKGLMDRWRNLRFVLVMGPPVGFFAPGGQWDFPAEVLAAYPHPNLLIEIMFPITWGGVWEYPYPEAQALIQQIHDLFAAGKLRCGAPTCRMSSASAPIRNAWITCAGISDF